MKAMSVQKPTSFFSADSYFIGSDDFVIILPHYHAASLCKYIISRFDEQIHELYDAEHLSAPPLVKNRDGEDVPLSPMTLSIAVASNKHHTFTTEDALSDAVAKVKKRCKMLEQNCYLHYDELELCRK